MRLQRQPYDLSGITTSLAMLTQSAESFVRSQDALSLFDIIERGHLGLFKHKVSQRESILIRDDEGDTLLMKAASHGYSEIVQQLLRYKLHVNTVNDQGDTALMFACSQGNVSVVKRLLNAKAIVDIPNESGATALDIATKNGGQQLFEFLSSQSTTVVPHGISLTRNTHNIAINGVESHPKERYKIVVLGESLPIHKVWRLLENGDFMAPQKELKSAFMMLSPKYEVWNPAGQERFASLAPIYYREANVLLYCTSAEKSIAEICYQRILQWNKGIRKMTKRHILHILVVYCKAKNMGKQIIDSFENTERFDEITYIVKGTRSANKIRSHFIELLDRVIQNDKLKEEELANELSLQLGIGETSCYADYYKLYPGNNAIIHKRSISNDDHIQLSPRQFSIFQQQKRLELLRSEEQKAVSDDNKCVLM